MRPSGDLLSRAIVQRAQEYREMFRVIVLNGPRQAGKSTLMRQMLAASGGEYRTLDDPQQLAAARSDPAGYIASGARPSYIDEVQRGGDSLVLAIKAAVDADNARGQFVLAGSTRFLAEPTLTESLAGRAAILEVLPFSQSELAAEAEPGQPTFLDIAFDSPEDLRTLALLPLTRSDYFELMVRGGYAEAARITSERARGAWFAGYLAGVVERDIRYMARINEPSAAAAVLRGLAAMTSQLLVSTTLATKADLSRETVNRYLELLEAVFLVQRLPAWSRNPLTKAVRRPKVHLVDTGLLCSLLGVNARALANPTSVMAGPVTETFVVNELHKLSTWAESAIRLHHYRDSHGNEEVDIIAETNDGRVIGIEVKAAVTVTGRDFRHLEKLDAKLGRDFVHGYVIHLGQSTLSFGEKLTAIPLGALWAKLSPGS
jgi:predicted AAA+ superfamily ATPase